MTKVVNLNKARKAKAKLADKALAAQNRIRFGRSGTQKAFDAAQQETRRRESDGRRLTGD